MYKKHLIGIVPLLQGDEVHMHIVEGSHPENKTITLNQTNLGCVLVIVLALLIGLLCFYLEKELLKRYKRE